MLFSHFSLDIFACNDFLKKCKPMYVKRFKTKLNCHENLINFVNNRKDKGGAAIMTSYTRCMATSLSYSVLSSPGSGGLVMLYAWKRTTQPVKSF